MSGLRLKVPALVHGSAIGVIALGALLTACGGGAKSVSATASDFSYTVNTSHAPAGNVHFTLKNDSKTYQHELWVYPTDQSKIRDLIAAKDAGKDVSEADYLQNVAGKVAALDPGKSAGFDANLSPGTYEYACFVASNIGGKTQVHYELGMHGSITVP